MTISRARLMAIALAVLAAVMVSVAIAFLAGKGCAPSPPAPIEVGIDAGPGERAIAARLDGAVQHARAELERIEREHAADIARFNEEQRRKYDQLADDPEAAHAFIVDFNRRLRGEK